MKDDEVNGNESGKLHCHPIVNDIVPRTQVYPRRRSVHGVPTLFRIPETNARLYIMVLVVAFLVRF
jgi:hypothetical protein